MSGIASGTMTGQSAYARAGAAAAYRCGSRNVVEYSYELPKGKHTNLVGSFSYRIPTQKADRLRTQVAVQKRRLQELEAKERTTLTRTPRKKAMLRAKIHYLEHELTHELACQTEVRISVSERDT